MKIIPLKMLYIVTLETSILPYLKETKIKDTDFIQKEI